jgi:hypothetical protein
MRSLGFTHLLLLGAFVVLVFDSRRLHTLARWTGRGRQLFTSGRGIPAGANPDQVGLPLRQIQMRANVDWQDGGVGWEGPEILPPYEPEPEPPVGESRSLPVLWKPFPALPAAGSTGDWLVPSKVA